MSCGCGSCGPCWACKILKILVALVLTYVMVAALMGAWTATAGFSALGSQTASSQLLTLAISAFLWLKIVKKLCPCGKKGCGCGCGGACNCGDKGGVCPGCGHSPCTCGK